MANRHANRRAKAEFLNRQRMRFVGGMAGVARKMSKTAN
jgi:hypothetical protein